MTLASNSCACSSRLTHITGLALWAEIDCLTIKSYECQSDIAKVDAVSKLVIRTPVNTDFTP